MTGAIKQTYLSDLHARTTDDTQTGLDAFTDDAPEDTLGTTIAVVTDPTGGIKEATDEFIPELGMPEPYLNDLRERRATLEEQGHTSIEAHNTAIDELDIEDKYTDHLEQHEELLDTLATRVANGETITFVCFEKEPKWCHRHTLVTTLNERLS